MRRQLLFLVFLFLGMMVYGQEASKITEILEAPQLTKGQASYIVASWLDPANETLDFNQATQVIVGQGLLKEEANASDAIRLDELSGLCMKAWEIPGGLFYRMFKSNRYAFRELKARGYLTANDYPSFSVSGFRGLNIMYACMEFNNAVLPTE